MRIEALRMDHVQRRVGGELTLSDLSMCCYAGTLHTVLMQSTSGRRALMDILAGSGVRERGDIYLFDEPYVVQSTYQAKRQGVFCVRHKSHLVSGLSIAENLFLTDRRYQRFGFTDSRRQNLAAAELLALARLDHLTPRQLAGTLPLHEAHMIEILRAVSQEARVLVFENVMERYSDAEMQQALRFLPALKEKGLCIILLCNKYIAPFDVADHATIVHNGVTIAHYDKGDITRETLLRHLNAKHYQRAAATPPERREVLRLQGVRVQGLSRPVDWSVRAGEVTGVWDQEFSHSYELVNAMFARAPAGAGSIRLDGRPLRRRAYGDVLRQGLVLIPERERTNYVFENMSLQENITLMMRAPLYRGGLRSEAMQRYASRHALETLHCEGLTPWLATKASLPPLRRHQQMQVVVAKWMCCRPKAIVFVNPFLLYDDLTLHELQGMMDRLCQRGIAVIVFSMNLRELEQVSDRVYHFQEGLTELA